ncbi:RAD51-associated protein 1 [Protobothrops mucrosquamatus]|uniref:RAD51-associated protein 1 n=1 Tax=Protobothrops mucrosquamatus TaxID=103944 RepID=UPI0007759DBB|nr:RAD51-associated protein 1 [Protobothrops mucrosquamatus]
MARRSGRSGRAAAAGPFQESDEDEDFAAPPKRARPAGRRVPLDEKVFQRDLEVTLALSLNEYVGNKDKTQEKDRLAEPKAAAQDFKQEVVISTPETDNVENLRANQENSQPHLEIEFSPSESVGKPLKTSSPSVGKKPSWTPPGASGSKTTLLGRAPVKSPVQGLRLGLSRHAKVKPLHPSCAGT